MALEARIDGELSTKPGGYVQVDISLEGYSGENIAAVALGVRYDPNILILDGVDSSFFHTFLEQWNLLDPPPATPLPPSVEVGGFVHTQPLLLKTTQGTGHVVANIAGIRVKEGNPETLLSMHFRVHALAQQGRHPLVLMPVVHSESQIPVLYGINMNAGTLSDSYPSYSPTLISGEIDVTSQFVDSDNDGIDDDWERFFFGDLTTADAFSDYDRDGYTDLQEYLNNLSGQVDPAGEKYDPTVANAPHGTGFDPEFSILYMILPVIIGGDR
jgi:hypothetical protein